MTDTNNDKKLPAAPPKMEEDVDTNNDDSDVELEGMDLDGLDNADDAPDDDAAEDGNDDVDDDDNDDAAAAANRGESPDHLEHEKEDIQHEQEDLQELEAARKERMELMAEELKREKELQEKEKKGTITGQGQSFNRGRRGCTIISHGHECTSDCVFEYTTQDFVRAV